MGKYSSVEFQIFVAVTPIWRNHNTSITSFSTWEVVALRFTVTLGSFSTFFFSDKLCQLNRERNSHVNVTENTGQKIGFGGYIRVPQISRINRIHI